MSDFKEELKKILSDGFAEKTPPSLIEAIELLAADWYAHPTKDGYCCACDWDIAGFEKESQKRLESFTERLMFSMRVKEKVFRGKAWRYELIENHLEEERRKQ